MKDQNCAYCMKNELLDKFGYLAFETNCSLVIVFKDQSHKGRMIVAHKNHISEIQYLTDEERNEYLADVAKVAKAIQKVYNPDKINYGAYGDTGCHLHFHLVPKYKDEFEWATPFAMNPGKTYLTPAEYDEMIEKIKENL